MFQLQNIRSMIRLTSNNIESLNAKFAHHQHPPSMYINEYEDLTCRLNEFQEVESRILELINDYDDNDIDDNSDDDDKMYLKAYLPNEQRSIVQCKVGQTLRSALEKPMKRRKLSCDLCYVFVLKSRQQLDWDDDVSKLNGQSEILVETKSEIKFPLQTSISHNFIRKTFFTLSFCDCCHRLLFHGFRCQTCQFKFHQRCAQSVPSLCKPLRVEINYYCHLLGE